MLRLHILLDAAAAALDARCLQTFANTGDCAARCVCNHTSNENLGKNTRLILSVVSLKNQQITRNSRAVRRQKKTLCDTISPPERSLCSHRFVDDGKPSIVAISLLPMHWALILSMAKCSSAERTMMHARCLLDNWDVRQLGCETYEAVVHGFGVSLRGCTSVCNGQKTAVLSFTLNW